MELKVLGHLKEHLKGKVVILGIGNTLRSDDGIGSLLAYRIQGKVSWIVYDAQECPENYLGKIVKDKPDNIVIIDAVDFAAAPGELGLLEAEDLKTVNLFSTHNSSVALLLNYLQTNLKADIIILIIQPADISLGDNLSPQVQAALTRLENWFIEAAKEKR